MSEHTPGPWRFTKTDDGVRRIEVPHRTLAITWAFMCDETYYPWCPDDDADWRLIAAAPELLAALKALREPLVTVDVDLECLACGAAADFDFIDERPSFPHKAECPWVLAQAAIAKAEGAHVSD